MLLVLLVLVAIDEVAEMTVTVVGAMLEALATLEDFV
jgi:hypothetical protein